MLKTKVLEISTIQNYYSSKDYYSLALSHSFVKNSVKMRSLGMKKGNMHSLRTCWEKPRNPGLPLSPVRAPGPRRRSCRPRLSLSLQRACETGIQTERFISLLSSKI